MLDQSHRPQSPAKPLERNDSTHPDVADKRGAIVPATLETDLEIEPVAYRYESWSTMADGWVESIRTRVETMPDPDQEQIRNITPLVPLSDVEALVEQMVTSRTGRQSHDQTDVRKDISRP